MEQTLRRTAHFLLLISFFPALAQDQPVETDSLKSKENENKNLPLRPGRSFEFDLTEGSWISLDVSPDGQAIVFDFLGDIYTLPVTGGEATQITQGMQFDSQPRYSPDGKKIVYISDESGGDNVWVYELETEEKRQITKGKDNFYQSPDWAPDGKYLLASKWSGRNLHKLWLFHIDGGTGAALVKEPESLRMTEGAFTPEGKQIWFSRRFGQWNYNASLPQYQIATYDRETGEIEVQGSRYGSTFRPTLSQDGRWLVYGTRHDDQTGLVLRNLDTGDEDWLAYPVQHDDQESRAMRDVLPGMAFTPDNQHVLTSYGGKIWKINISTRMASEIPFRIKGSIDLGPELDFDYPIEDTPDFIAKQIRDLAVSPNGSRLAFTVLNEIYVMTLPQGQPTRVTNLEETQAQPAWSPDGEWLAFVTWEPDGGKLYKVRPNGRNLLQLNRDEAVYQNPVWSADGSKIVVIKGQSEDFRNALRRTAFRGTSDLVWISSEGSPNNFIALTKGRSNPHFVKGSERIYLSGEEGLTSIRWDGTDEKYHVKVTGKKPPGAQNPPDASWIQMAPEGDQALAQVVNDLYVVTVPQVGEEAPAISVADPANAAFPARQITDFGGQFPVWHPDGTTVHYAIGNAHFMYDLNAATAFEDSVKMAKKDRQEKQDSSQVKEESELEIDSTGVKTADKENGKKVDPKYEPVEHRISVRKKRDIPQGVILLQNARIITMKGEEVIAKGDILIENNRIKQVGTGISAPAGATVRDLSGKTIIPGFVDTHAHFRHPVDLHRGQFWPYLANLAFGVTTTRDPQTATTDVLTYEDQVKAGKFIGPRIYSTGPGIFRGEMVKSQEHANDVMRRYSDYYDTKTIKMYGSGNRQQRQWLIIAAKEQEIMPTTEGGLDFKANLQQIIDGYPGHEHSFPVFPLYKDVIDLVAFSRCVYTPTLLVAYGGPWAENYFYATENPHADERLNRFMPHENLDMRTRRRNAGWFMEEEHVFVELSTVVKNLVEAGGRAGVGSHGQLQGLGYHWELWAMQAGGMSEHDALKVATIIAADGIGLDNDLGSIEAGKLADLVILNNNPLDNIRNTKDISHVMLNGRLYEASTLRQIHPQEAELPKLWWQDSGPNGVPGVDFNPDHRD